MAGELNPFRLRAPASTVSASDLIRGQQLVGSNLKDAVSGFSQFGQQQNTIDLNDLIARGGLEGKSTDEAQQIIANLGGTGGITPQMETLMEQGHQGRQQEDRQRQAEATAKTLFQRANVAQETKNIRDLKLFEDKQKAQLGNWVAGPKGSNVMVNNRTGEQMPFDSSVVNETHEQKFKRVMSTVPKDEQSRVKGFSRQAQEKYLEARLSGDINWHPAVQEVKKGGKVIQKGVAGYFMDSGNNPLVIKEWFKQQEGTKKLPTDATTDVKKTPKGFGQPDLPTAFPNEGKQGEGVGLLRALVNPNVGLPAMLKEQLPDMPFENPLQSMFDYGAKLGKQGSSNEVTANDLVAGNITDGKDIGTYDNLANQAGISSEQMNSTMTKLIDIESAGKGYTARNPTSSAFGKYQFMTGSEKSTGTQYARQLGYKGDAGQELRDWMTPDKQEEMFQRLTKDNIRGLKNSNLPIDTFHLYGAHQQGLTGFKDILSNEPKRFEKRMTNMKKNMGSTKGMSNQEIRDNWIVLWKEKTK